MTETILLVNSDTHFLARMQAIMEIGGYEVETAETASIAHRKLSHSAYAVLVADLSLAEGTAESLLERLAAESPHTEGILLALPTALPVLADLYDRTNLYNHCWKPLDDPGELLRSVARALERRALRRQNAYLLTELRDTRDELRSQSEFFVQIESLAALSQLTVAYVERLGTPLTELVQSACSLHRSLMSLCESPGSLTAETLPFLTAQAQCLVETTAGCDTLFRDLRDVFLCSSMERTPTDLHPLLERTLNLVQPLLRERGILLALDWQPETAAVQGDARRLQQALLHLFLNAVKAMPKGGALSVTTRALCATSDNAARLPLAIEIRDNGTGIAPEHLPHIFEPFFTTRKREETSTTGVMNQGTGLGLSVCRAILREHSGDIHVESVPARGTCVTLTFPGILEAPPPALLLRAA